MRVVVVVVVVAVTGWLARGIGNIGVSSDYYIINDNVKLAFSFFYRVRLSVGGFGDNLCNFCNLWRFRWA